MKKVLLFALVLFVSYTNASAQVVVTNDYDSPIQGDVTQKTSDNNESESLSYIGLGFYSFEGFNNWGFNDAYLNWNGLGFELAFRSQLKFNDYDNLNFDVGLNYSFGLWKDEDKKLYLSLAAGPSIRNQKEIEYSYNSKGKMSTKTKDKIFVDAFFNPRITFSIGKFVISGGYFYWAPKFKFDGDYKIDGFNANIGWSL